MNNQFYMRIVEEFKSRHPYLADGIEDWSPRGEMGIRVSMTDGTKYDYHAMSTSSGSVCSMLPVQEKVSPYAQANWNVP